MGRETQVRRLFGRFSAFLSRRSQRIAPCVQKVALHMSMIELSKVTRTHVTARATSCDPTRTVMNRALNGPPDTYSWGATSDRIESPKTGATRTKLPRTGCPGQTAVTSARLPCSRYFPLCAVSLLLACSAERRNRVRVSGSGQGPIRRCRRGPLEIGGCSTPRYKLTDERPATTRDDATGLRRAPITEGTLNKCGLLTDTQGYRISFVRRCRADTDRKAFRALIA